MACFDLHYSVTTRVGQHLKDEKKDNLPLIALTDLRPEEELNTARRASQTVRRDEDEEEEEEEGEEGGREEGEEEDGHEGGSEGEKERPCPLVPSVHYSL